MFSVPWAYGRIIQEEVVEGVTPKNRDQSTMTDFFENKPIAVCASSDRSNVFLNSILDTKLVGDVCDEMLAITEHKEDDGKQTTKRTKKRKTNILTSHESSKKKDLISMTSN